MILSAAAGAMFCVLYIYIVLVIFFNINFCVCDVVHLVFLNECSKEFIPTSVITVILILFWEMYTKMTESDSTNIGICILTADGRYAAQMVALPFGGDKRCSEDTANCTRNSVITAGCLYR